MNKAITRPSMMLGAAALLCLLVVQVAAAGGSGNPPAAASGVKKQVKKLKQRVKALEGQGQQPGPQGAQGAQGAQGPPGTFQSSIVARFHQFQIGGPSATFTQAECEPGEVAVGGGVGGLTSPGGDDAVLYSGPSVAGGVVPDEVFVPTAWDGAIRNSEASTKDFRIYVVCIEV